MGTRILRLQLPCPALSLRTLTVSATRLPSSPLTPTPSPLRLSKKEQAEFERLQRVSADASSSPGECSPGPKEEKEVEEQLLHPGIRRGAPPEFEGEVNPEPGEVEGSKSDALRLRTLTSATRPPSSPVTPTLSPLRLSKKEQAEFERLQRVSTGAFSSPGESTPEPKEGKAVEEQLLHPDIRRGAPAGFEGEVNLETGEAGGPKNDPLRHWRL